MAAEQEVGADVSKVRPPGRSRTGEPRSGTSGSAHHIATTVEEIHELNERDRREASWANRLADRVAQVSGSMPFVALHVVWFAIWILLNLPFAPSRFDSFPFGLLTMIVSLEAIFLSLFVLMSENRQARKDDRHAAVDLQVNLIAEREVTKVIEMLTTIQKTLGIEVADDDEIHEMNTPTRVHDLVDAVEGEETPG